MTTGPPLFLDTYNIINYHQKETLPAIFTKTNIEKNCSNIDELLLYCKQITKFLQKNKIYGNPYPIDVGAFEHLFSVLASYYKMPNLTRNQKLELVKTEQSIHWITGLTSPQDISCYLELIEECCEEERLCELIMLLYRKLHVKTNEGHKKLIHFLTPFIEYGSEYHKIMELTTSNIVTMLVMRTVDKLNKLGIANFDVGDEYFGDLSLLSKRLSDLKQKITEIDFMQKTEQYFYCLGLWSFTVHLLNFAQQKSYAFLRICVSTSFYFDYLRKTGEKILTSTSLQDEAKHYENLLPRLVRKATEKSTESIRVSVFEAMNCVLSILCEKKIRNVEGAEDIQKLLVVPFGEVSTNKEFLLAVPGSSFGSFASLFEQLLWHLLEITNQLLDGFVSTFRENKLHDLMILRILDVQLENNTAPIIAEKYYSTVEKLRKYNDSINKNMLIGCNFFKTCALKDVLAHNYNENTIIQLRYIIEALKDLPNKDKSQLQILLKSTFEISLLKMQGGTEIDKLKEIGIFLMRLLTVRDLGLENQRGKFFMIYLEFLVQKCKLNLWDLILLQESLWSNFVLIENFDTFCQSKLVKDFFKYYQEQVGNVQRELKKPLILNKIKESPAFKKVLWQFVLSSVNETAVSLESNEERKKFTYFTLQWADCLVMSFEPEKDQTCHEKLADIHGKLIEIFLSPFFIMSLGPSEKKVVNNYYSLILSSSQQSKWRATGALCHVVELLLTGGDLQKFVSSPEGSKELIFLIENFNDNDVLNYQLQISKPSLKIYSMMAGLVKLNSIFENVDICPYSQSERDAIIKQYSRTLDVLKDFISKIDFKTFVVSDRPKVAQFFSNFGQGMNAIFKPFNRMLPTHKMTIEFNLDLVRGVLKNDADAPLGYFLALFDGLKHSFSEVLLKKIINIILYADNIFTTLFQRVDAIIQEACENSTKKQNLFDDLDYIADFLSTLQSNLDLKLDKAKIQTFISDYLKRPFEKLVEDLFEAMTERIRKLSFWKVTAINSYGLNRALQHTITIFQSCFVIVKANTESRIIEEQRALKRPDMKILRHERERFYASGGAEDYNSTRYLFVAEPSKLQKIDKENLSEAKEDESLKLTESLHNLREIYEKNLQSSVQKTQSSLEKLKKRYETLDQGFCSSLGPFMLLFIDHHLTKIEAKNIETLRKSSSETLMQIFKKFPSLVSKENKDTADESLKEIDLLLEEDIEQALKIEIILNPVCNKINMLHGFLKTLKELIKKSSHELSISKSSIFCLHCSCKVLLTEFLNQDIEKLDFVSSGGLTKKRDFESSTQSVIDNMTSLLVTFYLCLLKKGETSSDEALSTLKWVELVFTLYQHNEPSWGSIFNHSTLISHLMNLIQVALCMNPNSSIKFLLKETFLLQVFLDSKGYMPWNSKVLTSLTFIFSSLLQNSISDEIAIDQGMKKLVGVGGCKLDNLEHEPFVQRAFHKAPEVLLSTFQKNFTIILGDKNSLDISLDLSKQGSTTPSFQIQEILRNLNGDAKILIDILTEAVIDNHIFNMSVVSSEVGTFRYKETTNIMTLISALASKYPHIAIYLGFNKKSARENQTFLERLFGLNYFDVHCQDLLTMIKTLCSPLGVPFVLDRNLLLDVSHIFMDKVLESLASKLAQETKKFENEASSAHESYLSFHSIVISFTFLWTEIETSVSNEIFERLFRVKVLNLFKDILSAWRFIAVQFYPVLKNCGSLDSIMAKLLSYYFNSRLKLCSVDANSIINHKTENYHEYLQSGESLAETTPHILDEISKEILLVESLSKPRKDKNHDEPTKNFSELWESENQLIFPIVAGTRVCKDQTISEDLSQRVQAFEALLQSKKDSVKNLGNYLKKMSICAETPSKVQKDFSTPLHLKYTLILEEGESHGQSKKIEKGCSLVNLIHSYHTMVSHGLEERSRPTETHQSIDHPEEEKVVEIFSSPVVKYFFHDRLNDVSTLSSIENQMMIQLKFVSEQVLLTLAQSVANNKIPEYQKKVTTEEVENYDKSLSDFDRNLLLCLLGNFEILNNFEYPPNFKEIKEEYTWMKTNFTDYLKELNHLRKPLESNNNEPSSHSHSPFTFSNEAIHFQSNSSPPQIVLPSGSFKTPSEKDIQLFEQLYFVDDTLVESLMSFFFIEYEKGFANTNPAIIQMLQELCKVPAFEAKILDFCLAFIHCPQILVKGCAVDIQKSPFYDQIFKFKTQKGFNFQNIVVSNILDFLKCHLKNNEYLLYLSRQVLASQRLATLRTNSSLEKEYLQKTCSSVSVLDLLIASLNVSQSPVKESLQSIILDFFSKERAFNIVDVSHKCVTSLVQYKVLTTKSCQKLLQNLNPDTILKNVPSIIFYDIDSVLLQIEKKIQELETVLEVTNAILYRKMKEDVSEVVNALDIENLSQKQTVLKSLEELVSFISSSLASWTLNQRKTCQQVENIQLYQDVLKTLQNRLFSQKNVNEFMVNLFELATYLLHKNLTQSNKTFPLATSVLKICVHFYTILHVNDEFMMIDLEKKYQVVGKKNSNLLSDIKLSLPKEIIKGIPDPIHSFRKIKRSEKFDYQSLLADLCMKHPETLFKVFSEDSGKKRFQKEISLIQDKVLWVLDLNTKKRLLTYFFPSSSAIFKISHRTMIKNHYDEAGHGNSTRQIEINRKDLLNSSIHHFSNQPLSIIRQRVQVSFLNEFGMDGGGLRREWYAIIAAELFDPKKGLFKLSKDNVTLQPNPIASMVPSHLKFFEFAGIIIAKAMVEDCVVDAYLSRPFIKHLMQKDISLYDLADIDPEFEKSLRWILTNPVEGLEQQFTYEVEFFESRFTEELVSSGHETLVTEANKKMFVQKVCEARVRDEVSEELAAFIRGFSLIIPTEFLRLFSVEELQALIGGVRTINVQDMQKFASYTGFDKDCEQMKWFWEILSGFSQDELGAFWFFTSGSPKPAFGGFKEKPLKISKNSCTSDRLPIARTCSTTIEMPVYGSKQQMKEKLLCSITDGQRSFMFS